MSEGLVIVVSSHPFEDTLNALVARVKHRQVEVFGMVDHAANAQGAGLTLGRTTVVTFGGAKAGTPLMQAHQMLGLDLPLRALVYETAEGQVRIAYREPRDILAGQGWRRTPSLRWPACRPCWRRSRPRPPGANPNRRRAPRRLDLYPIAAHRSADVGPPVAPGSAETLSTNCLGSHCPAHYGGHPSIHAARGSSAVFRCWPRRARKRVRPVSFGFARSNRKYARKYFKEDFIQAYFAGFAHKPGTTYGTVNVGICERYIPGHRTPNASDLMAASPFPDSE
jgi:uncharacterized protein (DUF302 family)